MRMYIRVLQEGIVQFNCLGNERPTVALCLEGGWCFPECFAVSEKSLSPSLTLKESSVTLMFFSTVQFILNVYSQIFVIVHCVYIDPMD